MLLKNKGKKAVEEDLGDLLGGLNPELQKFADLLASFMPADSFLRSEGADRLWGILSDSVERRADSLPFPWSRVIEKGSDLIEFLSRSLREGKSTSSTLSRLNWQENFFKQAQDRLAKAQDVSAEAKKIEEEFKALGVIMEAMKTAQGITAGSTSTSHKSVKEGITELVNEVKKFDKKVGDMFKDFLKN